MKYVMIFFGALLFLSGGVWFLQGVNILPGSFMTGQTEWIWYGLIAMIAGAALLVLGARRGRAQGR